VAKLKRITRRDRALQWRRDYVLDCAEQVFARKGFHNATMQEIAGEAEYATGTLYGFFDSKDDLFAAMIERRLPEIDRYLRESFERGSSVMEKIESFAGAFFEFFDAQKPLFQIYVNVTGGFIWLMKAGLGEKLVQNHLAFLEFLEEVMRAGIEKGELRAGLDPRLAAVSLVGTMSATATDWITRTPDRPFLGMLEGTLDLLRPMLLPVSPVRKRA